MKTLAPQNQPLPPLPQLIRSLESLPLNTPTIYHSSEAPFEPLSLARQQDPTLNELCCYLTAHSTASQDGIIESYRDDSPSRSNNNDHHLYSKLCPFPMYQLSQMYERGCNPHGGNDHSHKNPHTLYLVTRINNPPLPYSSDYTRAHNLTEWLIQTTTHQYKKPQSYQEKKKQSATPTSTPPAPFKKKQKQKSRTKYNPLSVV